MATSVASQLSVPATQVVHELLATARCVALGRQLTEPRLRELASSVSALSLHELPAPDLFEVLRACGRVRLKDPVLWQQAAPLVSSRLATANDVVLANGVSALAAVRLHEVNALSHAGRRAAELCSLQGGGFCGPAAARFLRDFSLLEAKLVEDSLLGHLLESITQDADSLTLRDIAGALTGIARVDARHIAIDKVMDTLRLRLLELSNAASREGPDVEPREVTWLVTCFVKLGYRDEAVLRAITNALARSCARGDVVPPNCLPTLVRGLATQLGPPPASLARVLEASLPRAVATFKVSELVVVVCALAFIPGLRASRGGLGRAVFGACLAALPSLRPRALVGMLRSALALKYYDPTFLAPFMCEAERSLLSDEVNWGVDDLASASLFAAKVVHLTSPGKSDAKASQDDSQKPPLLAAAPAASALLRVAANVAGERAYEFSPREVALVSYALARARMEDGPLFALLAHRAMGLLSLGDANQTFSPKQSRCGKPTQPATNFASRDVAQLLAALAAFDYQDEPLLMSLAAHAEAGFQSYDDVARDIILTAFSHLGGLPSEGRFRHLEESLLEYELSRNIVTDRTGQHLCATEVLPADGEATVASHVSSLKQVCLEKAENLRDTTGPLRSSNTPHRTTSEDSRRSGRKSGRRTA